MDKINEYTITQVAEMLKCSRQTIYRRIDDGEYPGAHKVKDLSGVETWVIPAHFIDEALEIKDVVPLTRQIALPDLISAISIAFRNEVAPIKDDIEQLKIQIAELSLSKDELESLRTEINDLSTRLTPEYLRGALKQKSFWDKFKHK